MSDTPTPFTLLAPAAQAQFWAETIPDFAASGQSVRAFCSARGLSEKQFYTWPKSLGLSPAARSTTPPAPPAHAFVPVRVLADALAEITLPGGVTLRVPLTADPAHVARLADARRGAAC